MSEVSVKLLRNDVGLWDQETGITIIDKGCFDAEGNPVSMVPETRFIQQKVKEGLLQIVEETDTYNALRARAKELGLEVPRGTSKEQLLAMLEGKAQGEPKDVPPSIDTPKPKKTPQKAS